MTDGLTGLATAGEWRSGREFTQYDYKNYDPVTGRYLPKNESIYAQLDWSETQSITAVSLSDRPNNDWVLAGTLIFSDGSSVMSGPLSNDGTPKIISFPPKYVQWVRYVIDKVADPAQSIVGLNEFEAYRSSTAAAAVIQTTPPITGTDSMGSVSSSETVKDTNTLLPTEGSNL